MTYEQARKDFFLFRGLSTVQQLRSFLNFKRRDKHTISALIYYAAERGIIYVNGQLLQVFEYNRGEDVLRVAELKLEGFIGENSIVRKEGCEYVIAYNESWAKIKLNIKS